MWGFIKALSHWRAKLLVQLCYKKRFIQILKMITGLLLANFSMITNFKIVSNPVSKILILLLHQFRTFYDYLDIAMILWRY